MENNQSPILPLSPLYFKYRANKYDPCFSKAQRIESWCSVHGIETETFEPIDVDKENLIAQSGMTLDEFRRLSSPPSGIDPTVFENGLVNLINSNLGKTVYLILYLSTGCQRSLKFLQEWKNRGYDVISQPPQGSVFYRYDQVPVLFFRNMGLLQNGRGRFGMPFVLEFSSSNKINRQQLKNSLKQTYTVTLNNINSFIDTVTSQ